MPNSTERPGSSFFDGDLQSGDGLLLQLWFFFEPEANNSSEERADGIDKEISSVVGDCLPPRLEMCDGKGSLPDKRK